MDEIEFSISEDQLRAIENEAQLLAVLDSINDELYVTDVTDLIQFYEELENYEFCQIIKNYKWDEI